MIKKGEKLIILAKNSIFTRWKNEWADFIKERKILINMPIFLVSIGISSSPVGFIALSDHNSYSMSGYQIVWGAFLLIAIATWFSGLAVVAVSEALFDNIPLISDIGSFFDYSDGVEMKLVKKVLEKKTSIEEKIEAFLLRLLLKIVLISNKITKFFLKSVIRNLRFDAKKILKAFISFFIAWTCFAITITFLAFIGVFSLIPHMKINIARLPILLCFGIYFLALIFLSKISNNVPVVIGLGLVGYTVFFVDREQLFKIQKIGKYFVKNF